MSSKTKPCRPCIALAVVLALTGAASAPAGLAQPARVVRNGPPPRLTATVSASGAVSLTEARGHVVKRLRNGWYTVAIMVNSPNADFHLTGPKVQRVTRPRFTGVAIWGLHFLKGTYRYMSDRRVRATRRTISVY